MDINIVVMFIWYPYYLIRWSNDIPIDIYMPWYITSLYIQGLRSQTRTAPSHMRRCSWNISREVRILETILNSTFIYSFLAIQLPRSQDFRNNFKLHIYYSFLGYPIAKKYRILETILNSTFIILFWAIQLPSRQNRKLTETQEGLFFFFPLSSSVCSLLWFFFFFFCIFFFLPEPVIFFNFVMLLKWWWPSRSIYIFSQIYLFFDI